MTPRLRSTWAALTVLICGACANQPGPTAPPPTPSASAAPNPPAPGPAPPSPTSIQDEVTGDYLLTVDLGSGCSVVPAAERIRSYSATITSEREASYLVTLTTGTFLQGAICTFHERGTGCNQFTAERTDDRITFDLANNNDTAHGGHIVEQLSGGTWLEIIGQAAGRREGTTIDASGTSNVWYCSSRLGYPFPCATYAGCESSDMTLRFVRK